MALVHYGFSREEALWMPIPEVNDYIQLINEQVAAESEASEIGERSQKENETPTFRDVFRGGVGL